MSLNVAEKKAVEESWARVSQPSFQDAGEKVFLKLLKNKFTKANFKKFRDIPFDQLPGNAALREHGGQVVQVLDDFIKGLDGSGYEAVKKVGRIHKAEGMTSEKIELMKLALCEVLDDAGCGDHVTKAAWEKLWRLFMAAHSDGY
ncbi:HBZ [Branchiostoma lanceolatum]|uniref:HBZ protein n=1 Tax=Branchiostoma lanceolatum TaxID=7740 RepID=A0A8J9YRE7_BRALA|nr:HBZ [Branchiostoma lanceolatum]